MTSISKNVYSDKLIDIVNEYNSTYHRTIKIKPVDVNSSTYIDFGIENNKNPKDLLNTVFSTVQNFFLCMITKLFVISTFFWFLYTIF